MKATRNNRRVNYIPPIAQHHMILRALAHVSEERIATALNVTVATIREKRDLLKGICPKPRTFSAMNVSARTPFCALTQE